MADGKRRHEIQMTSKSGPIDVFLIQDPQQISVQEESGPSAGTAEGSTSAMTTVAGMDDSADTILKHLEFPSSEVYEYEMRAPTEDHPSHLYEYPDVMNIFSPSHHNEAFIK